MSQTVEQMRERLSKNERKTASQQDSGKVAVFQQNLFTVYNILIKRLNGI
jgi:hypothetical protein